ncbi:MAG: guanylate kinase [Verrucomicrobiales bacterium]
MSEAAGNKAAGLRQGLLLVLSGPAGAGKSTVLRTAVESDPALRFSVSCTTRPAREDEVDGIDYHFLSDDEFAGKLEAEEFLEHAGVHKWRYGTLRASVVDLIEEGIDVIMDIDVQGAEQIRACSEPLISRTHVDIFMMPADTAELERRLRARGSEDEETFRLRMKNALAELKHWRHYTYRILSSSREADYESFVNILRAERLRVARFL